MKTEKTAADMIPGFLLSVMCAFVGIFDAANAVKYVMLGNDGRALVSCFAAGIFFVLAARRIVRDIVRVD